MGESHRKGHRWVLELKKEEHMQATVAERNPAEGCTATQLQFKPGTPTVIPPLAEVVQVCSANLGGDFFLEVIRSHTEILKSS